MPRPSTPFLVTILGIVVTCFRAARSAIITSTLDDAMFVCSATFFGLAEMPAAPTLFGGRELISTCNLSEAIGLPRMWDMSYASLTEMEEMSPMKTMMLVKVV